MYKYKPGDLVKTRYLDYGPYDFFHVVHAESNGGLYVIGDWDGQRYGLSANYSKNKPATLKELVQHWQQYGRTKPYH